ncbi:hypothetical protein KQI86_04040 [Clostridium sp. MSJ-11]|uniref:Uncharacterized protein n=1 Tax=Clostridium mobile TaxID=2841512 RepID=A0ABS6EFD9_9CLOT|nr:hypothetical protein [Clostridium mobile]MBU5483487.1 hypothetical protein [Clostridium mobile]
MVEGKRSGYLIIHYLNIKGMPDYMVFTDKKYHQRLKTFAMSLNEIINKEENIDEKLKKMIDKYKNTDEVIKL